VLTPPFPFGGDRGRWLVSLAVGVAFLVCTTAASAACWSSTRVVGTAAHDADVDSLAVTSQGRVVELWNNVLGSDPSAPSRELYQESAALLRQDSLRLVSKRPLAAARAESAGGQAISTSGDVVIVWFQQRRLRWSRLRAGSTKWSPARFLPAAPGQTIADSRLISRPDGSILLIWESWAKDERSARLLVSTLSPGALHWSRPHVASKIAGTTSDRLFVETLPSGTIRVVWGRPLHRRWVQLPAGSSTGWRAEQGSLAQPPSLQLTAGADGTLVALWTMLSYGNDQADGSSDTREWVMAAVRHPGQRAFSQPQRVTPDAPDTEGYATVTIGADGAATLVAGWTVRHSVVVQSLAQPLSAPKLTPAGVATYALRSTGETFTRVAHGLSTFPLAFVALGDGTALAIESQTNVPTDHSLTVTRGIPGAARWGHAEKTLGSGNSINSGVVVATAPDGGAVVGWESERDNSSASTTTARFGVMLARFSAARTCGRWGLPPSR
jgi:hypothetical protein